MAGAGVGGAVGEGVQVRGGRAGAIGFRVEAQQKCSGAIMGGFGGGVCEG